MGTLLICVNASTRRVPLPRSALLGRHAICHAVIAHRDVPLHWLEVRWLGDQWAWRPLHDHGSRTRGPGKILGDGWRACVSGTGSGKISCGEHVWVRLEDAEPPSVFAVDLGSQTYLTGVELDDWVECWDSRLYELGQEPTGSTSISDNDVRVIRGRALRFHVPGTLPSTDNFKVSVGADDCMVDIDVPRLTAVFTVGATDVTIHGECVRVLAAYAHLRLHDRTPDSGWGARHELFAVWKELGGHPSSPEERIGWEKGKLRNRLIRVGAGGAESLFENRFSRGQTESRICLRSEQIKLSIN